MNNIIKSFIFIFLVLILVVPVVVSYTREAYWRHLTEEQRMPPVNPVLWKF